MVHTYRANRRKDIEDFCKLLVRSDLKITA